MKKVVTIRQKCYYNISNVKKINKVEVAIIYPNIPRIEKLIKNNFNNNKSAFARRIGIDRTTLSKIMSRRKAGSKFFGKLLGYCEEEGLNYRDYILLRSELEEED